MGNAGATPLGTDGVADLKTILSCICVVLRSAVVPPFCDGDMVDPRNTCVPIVLSR